MVRGYKVFSRDWKCRNKQYTCPGVFEETDGEISLCSYGMHFCKRLIDCFNYYTFSPDNKVAEVIAHGKIEEGENKCCTDKLEIVRELSWEEVLERVNLGDDNEGMSNIGHCNFGDNNVGCFNCGNKNTSNNNFGSKNTAFGNWGNRNSGQCNIGDKNTGERNQGDSNSGSYNCGHYNTGHGNAGHCNAGSFNVGHFNSGDWNMTDSSSGCFNTQEEKLIMFNRPSSWTREEWVLSQARSILMEMPMNRRMIIEDPHTSVEIWNDSLMGQKHTHLRLSTEKVPAEERMEWWRGLSEQDKHIIKSMPNFDAEIFMEITGIDVRE